MKRIFAAIEITAEAKQNTAVYTENLRRKFPYLRIGWERSEKLHLTLKFFGEVDENQLENIKIAASETAKQIETFKLKISGNGVFPNRQRAKILWLGVEDVKGYLQRLNQIFENEYKKFGFPTENRKFKPHLTIGRLHEPEKAEEIVTEHLSENVDCKEFEVSELTIFESKLLPQGSKYSIISKHCFGRKNKLI